MAPKNKTIGNFDEYHWLFIDEYPEYYWLFKALAHTTQKRKKCSYLPYTLQLFFSTATIFSTVLYMDTDFHSNCFRKMFVDIVVVHEGL